jgi:DNA-binding CsgD family transcriptional regulator
VKNGDQAYEVVTADAREDRVRVRLRRISAETLGAIYESKVRALSDAAQLSDRERSVLTYLLMGRSLSDIAMILDISPRTVKFHQANVLEKLGADSRADLVRLIT